MSSVVNKKNAAFLVPIPALLIGATILSVGTITYSWLHIDSLTAVPHVEDILLLARDMGLIWFLLGIISLVLLLIPFLSFPKVSMLSKAVGLYYFVMIVSSFLGNFPVPFMGFGISPIIGYLLALLFLIRENATASSVTTYLHDTRNQNNNNLW